KEPNGVLISDVMQQSPAATAGIASGDVIIEFDKKKVDSPQELQKAVAATAPGRAVPLKVWREKAEKTLEIKIGETPDETAALKPTTKGKVTRGWLGVSIQPLTPELAKSFGLKEPNGVLISDVMQQSPAAAAGIASGDVIIEFDRKKVDSPQELQKAVAATTPGRAVPLKVWREKAEKTLEIKIGETPDETVALKPTTKGKSLLGLDVRPLTPELARQLNLRTPDGVIVFSVDEESAASEAGLQRGDVIREVNRQKVRSVQDFEKVTKDVKDGDRVTVLLQRGPQSLYVAFTVARG
ncbi:MAG TPA: PDZ domain-containing protein, partial [Methylomirabilota bacterium]|nr:PDZ domain-containing protein [Methylomirabilota bacterium]